MSHDLSSQPLVVVGISGSPSTRSRSRALLASAIDVLRDEGAEVSAIDLSSLPAAALLAREASPDVADAIARVAAAHIVIASTPVYRATYTGLLKTFFDLLPLHALDGKVALGLATGGAPGHEGVLDHGLRPLFASLDAIVAPRAVFATDASFADGIPDAALTSRARLAALGALRLAEGIREGAQGADSSQALATPATQ